MLRLKKLLLIFVALCTETAFSSQPIQSVNHDWTFTSDYSKTRVSIAPNKDYKKFAYAVCDDVEQNRTEINCTVTVESNIFSDAPDKKVCELKIHSEDGYYINNGTYKLKMLDSDKVIVYLEEVPTSSTERLGLFTNNNPSILKVRTVDMSSCRSTGSDVVVKLKRAFWILPTYHVIPHEGTLNIVTKLDQTPCNGSYCILTYDALGKEIGKPTPVIPQDNFEPGVLLDLVPSSGSHVAVFVGSVQDSMRAHYVEPQNNVLRPMVIKDKTMNEEVSYNFDFSNGHARLSVCYQNSTFIDCKQLDERFSLKINVAFPRQNEKVKQILNLKEGGFLLLADRYDTEDMQLWRIDENGRRQTIVSFEKFKCVDTERLYEGESEFCLISTCKHLDTTRQGFKYKISSRCVNKQN